jgi:hypothetical protein
METEHSPTAGTQAPWKKVPLPPSITSVAAKEPLMEAPNEHQDKKNVRSPSVQPVFVLRRSLGESARSLKDVDDMSSTQQMRGKVGLVLSTSSALTSALIGRNELPPNIGTAPNDDAARQHHIAASVTNASQSPFSSSPYKHAPVPPEAVFPPMPQSPDSNVQHRSSPVHSIGDADPRQYQAAAQQGSSLQNQVPRPPSPSSTEQEQSIVNSAVGGDDNRVVTYDKQSRNSSSGLSSRPAMLRSDSGSRHDTQKTTTPPESLTSGEVSKMISRSSGGEKIPSARPPESIPALETEPETENVKVPSKYTWSC